MQHRILVEIDYEGDYSDLHQAQNAPDVREAAYNLADALVRVPALKGFRRVRVFGIDGNEYLAEAFKR